MKDGGTEMVLITKNLSDATMEKVMRFKNARDVWQELHRLFDGVSEDKAFGICMEFFGFKRDPNSKISGNFSKLKNMWNELKLVIPKGRIICLNKNICYCLNITTRWKSKDEENLLIFLPDFF